MKKFIFFVCTLATCLAARADQDTEIILARAAKDFLAQQKDADYSAMRSILQEQVLPLLEKLPNSPLYTVFAVNDIGVHSKDIDSEVKTSVEELYTWLSPQIQEKINEIKKTLPRITTTKAGDYSAVIAQLKDKISDLVTQLEPYPNLHAKYTAIQEAIKTGLENVQRAEDVYMYVQQEFDIDEPEQEINTAAAQQELATLKQEILKTEQHKVDNAQRIATLKKTAADTQKRRVRHTRIIQKNVRALRTARPEAKKTLQDQLAQEQEKLNKAKDTLHATHSELHETATTQEDEYEKLMSQLVQKEELVKLASGSEKERALTKQKRDTLRAALQKEKDTATLAEQQAKESLTKATDLAKDKQLVLTQALTAATSKDALATAIDRAQEAALDAAVAREDALEAHELYDRAQQHVHTLEAQLLKLRAIEDSEQHKIARRQRQTRQTPTKKQIKKSRKTRK